MAYHRLTLAAVALALALALGGCASTTTIQTEPSGAEVIMDGTIKLGKTPIEIKEMVWVWTDHRFLARAPGYAPQGFTIPHEYPWGQNLVVCLCTGGLMWPVLLASRYTSTHRVVLAPAASASREAIEAESVVHFDSR